ncbi:unnamed protein product [Lampetra fluviatilis]
MLSSSNERQPTQPTAFVFLERDAADEAGLSRSAARTLVTCEMTRFCVVGLLWALISAGSCLGADQLSCPTFRRVTNQGAAGAVEVLARPVPGHHLSVCRPRALSCCSRSVEAQLGPAARLDLQHLVEESSHFPLAAFQSQYSKMDDYMGDLLRRAEASLHDMFVRSYGVIYTQNADLFLWLFSQLRLYAGVSAPPPPAPPQPPHRRPPGGPPPRVPAVSARIGRRRRRRRSWTEGRSAARRPGREISRGGGATWGGRRWTARARREDEEEEGEEGGPQHPPAWVGGGGDAGRGES